jgi:hypothetical protein
VKVRHRGGQQTESSYGGVPIHAAESVHEAAVHLLRQRLPPNAAVADIGAGQGALSERLHDAGFAVTAFDLSSENWQSRNVVCRECDFNDSLQQIGQYGPFDALCAIEVIEHLENPRAFLGQLIELGRAKRAWLVISTPNPLDTFSAITIFTRGIFNWFSPAHYEGGGHISILPYWLIDEHLSFFGVTGQEWRFLSPFRHPTFFKRLAYRLVGSLRRLVSRSGNRAYFDGESALMFVRL